MGAAAQFTYPLPQFGGGDIKNVQAGTERQHHHHEIRRRTPAEQQKIAAQQGTDGTAAQPGMDAVLIALRYHAGRRDVGGDLEKTMTVPLANTSPSISLNIWPMRSSPRV